MPDPFTPEQEARIRAIVRELLAVPEGTLIGAIRASLDQTGRRNVSIFGADDLPGEKKRVSADLAHDREC